MNVSVVIPYNERAEVPRAYTLDWETDANYIIGSELFIVGGRYTAKRPKGVDTKAVARVVDLPTASQPALGFELV